MKTLVLSDFRLPDADSLQMGASKMNIKVVSLENWRRLEHRNISCLAFHGDVSTGKNLTAENKLFLLEPELDFLAKLAWDDVKRDLQISMLSDVRNFREPMFIKPIDPEDKDVFNAGVYTDGRDIKVRSHKTDLMVMVSEPVDWRVEYRCFCTNHVVVDGTPYYRSGRIFRYGEGRWPVQQQEWSVVKRFVEDFLSRHSETLPPGVVVDVGFIENRGWAIIELNPAWCATLYGCDPEKVLIVLFQCCFGAHEKRGSVKRWILR